MKSLRWRYPRASILEYRKTKVSDGSLTLGKDKRAPKSSVISISRYSTVPYAYYKGNRGFKTDPEGLITPIHYRT